MQSFIINLNENCSGRTDVRDASNFIICPMLCYNQLYSSKNSDSSIKQESRAVAGKPRDAPVNFDTQCLGKSAASVAYVHKFVDVRQIWT